MRSEQEMYQLIFTFARLNPDIRAAYLNGSRANPQAIKDRFQDYDLVYVVEKTAPYLTDHKWISYFGSIIIMQEPDNPSLFNDGKNPEDAYTFLMLFDDGNRIDLTFQSLSYTRQVYGQDKLTLPLWDKDKILPDLLPPTDLDYQVKPPSLKEFQGCCNEFWWLSTYIAKGLWRNEILYAMDHINLHVRPMLTMMLGWYAGSDYGYQINIGKSGKYLKQYLPDRIWQSLLYTFPTAQIEAVWDALFSMCDLFSQVSAYVAKQTGHAIDQEEEKRTRSYLQFVKSL